MTVATIMGQKGRRVITLTPAHTLAEVSRTLAENKIGALVLTDSEGMIAGILSERDVVRALAKEGAAALDAPASRYMSARVITCHEEDTIDHVMSVMTQGRFRHMPVVKNKRLIGVVSIGDVVKLKIEKAEREAADIKAYIASA
jgi:CBS domain-containing protein